ncbi:MAG: 1-phosphofructokinase family hexose kinase [Oscillospiraceae bacterium]|nr:1-phosphofructokinase family hexose kinase [Oscillospiraceae bacterium]
MIYTVTLNPAIDYFITLKDELMVDEVNRGTGELFKAGGKGLNVSKTLSILGVPSRAVALLGGFTGAFIRDAFRDDANITVMPVWIEGNNRINLKAMYDHKALCINGTGPSVTEEDRKRILELFGEIAEGDTVVISGSMMPGLDEDFVTEAADIIHGCGAKLVIDMEKISPETLMRCRPDLIKPNLYELGLILGSEQLDKKNAPEALDRLVGAGVGAVLLSLGRDGAMYVDGSERLRLTHPDTVMVNKVGAGDAMLASFIGMKESGRGVREALRYGGAAGNAVASKLEDITAEDIEKFLPLMEVLDMQD